MKYKLILSILIFAIVSCTKPKYEVCDHANFCIRNTGPNKIPYSWGASQLLDTLKPGQTVCKDAGYLNTDPKVQSFSVVYFETPNKSNAYRPTSCNMSTDVQ